MKGSYLWVFYLHIISYQTIHLQFPLFPKSFESQTQINLTHPVIFIYNSHPSLITTSGFYSFQPSPHNRSTLLLNPFSPPFTTNPTFYSSNSLSKVFTYTIPNSNHDQFLFYPYNNGNLLWLHPSSPNNPENNYIYKPQHSPVGTVIANKYNINISIISYLISDAGYEDSYLGYFIIVDPLYQEILVQHKTQSRFNDKDFCFYCKAVDNDCVLCMFGRGDNLLYYSVYYLSSNHSEEYNVDIGLDVDSRIQAVKFIVVSKDIEYDIYVGVFDAKTEQIILVKGEFNEGRVHVLERSSNVIDCEDGNGFDLYIIRNDLFMINVFNGYHTLCRFFDKEFYMYNKHVDICGEYNFRFFLFDTLNMFSIVYNMNDLIYYIEGTFIKTKNIIIQSSTREESVINYQDAIDAIDDIDPNAPPHNEPKEDRFNDHNNREDENYREHEHQPPINNKSHGQIFIKFIGNISNIGGTLSNTDSSTFVVEEDTIYSNITYLPNIAGTFEIQCIILEQKTNDFYIPSSPTLITFINECYYTCKTCTYMGNNINHNCDECKEGYLLLYNTNNCYQSLPGYYIGNNSTLIPCSSHCAYCLDADNCYLCEQGYTFLYEYTNITSDKQCVIKCDLSSMKWYINDTNDINCLDDNYQCPFDYPLYLTATKQCIPTTNTKLNSSTPLPNYTSTEDIFSFIDKQINNIPLDTVLQSSNYTIYLRYTSSSSDMKTHPTTIDNNNFEYPTIFLSSCELELKSLYNISGDSSLLFAEINMIYNNTFSFLIYSPLGERLNISKCKTHFIEINHTIETKPKLSNIQLEELYSLDIDILNPQIPFYNDKCTKHNSLLKQDSSLYIRRNHLYHNISLCYKGCNYSFYDIENNIINCKCNPQLMNENKVYNKDLRDNNIFLSNITRNNLDVLKCKSLVFDGDVLSKNISFHAGFILMVFQIGICIYDMCTLHKKDIKIKHNRPFPHPPIKQLNTSKTKSMFFKVNAQTTQPKGKTINSKQNKTNNNSNNTSSNNNSIKTRKPFYLKVEPSSKKYKPVMINSTSKVSSSHSSRIILDNSLKEKKLSFKEAIRSDKRSLLSIYNSKIKATFTLFHLLQTTTCIKEYFITIILSYYIILLQALLFFNAWFYSDANIEHNYFNSGYNIKREIDKIIYAMISSKSMIFVFKQIGFMYSPIDKCKGKHLVNRIYIVHCIYFVLCLTFGTFFWYYVSLFSAVYPNTQSKYFISVSLCCFLYLFAELGLVFCVAVTWKIGTVCRREKMYHCSKLLEVI